jgi:hypothetical protein
MRSYIAVRVVRWNYRTRPTKKYSEISWSFNNQVSQCAA